LAVLSVTPDTFQEALDRASAGDCIHLQAGDYDGRYTLSRKQGSPNQPIVIEPAPGTDPETCKISQGISADCFRPVSNRLAQRSRDLGYRLPGLYPWIDDASLRLYRCAHVTLRGLKFCLSWPTHIFIDASRGITIHDCHFEDATYCIGARGETTQDILIEHCTWTQDTVPDRLWSQIPWVRMHGETVDLRDDYRLFDGDFFRSNEISGGVTIRHCVIKAAFNAIHGYNASMLDGLNRDFNISHNRFEQIRDNVFEPEDGASNWWFHHNHMVDVHKWFSIQCPTRGPMYIFSNTGTFRTQQGAHPLPGETDEYVGGAVFKAIGKVKDAQGPFGDLHVFHNSFVTRSRYIKKGVLPGLKHTNNAIAYRPAHGEDPRQGGFFGTRYGPEYAKRFTSNWARWDIRFEGDVICFPAFPDEVRAAGYPLSKTVVGGDPGFVDDSAEPDALAVSAQSPAANASLPLTLELPSGPWSAPGGQTVGAWQGPPDAPASTRFDGPKFEATLGTTPCETTVRV